MGFTPPVYVQGNGGLRVTTDISGLAEGPDVQGVPNPVQQGTV
jgi:hypothetical protein